MYVCMSARMYLCMHAYVCMYAYMCKKMFISACVFILDLFDYKQLAQPGHKPQELEAERARGLRRSAEAEAAGALRAEARPCLGSVG